MFPWERVAIMPVGDIQLGSPGTDLKHLRQHIQWGVDNDVYFLGMGDYTDFLSPSNRRHLKNSGLYDTAMDIIEEIGHRHLETLQEVLAPSVGRWLGLHEGHHTYEFGDGTTTDTLLAQYLKTPFLGTAATTRLKFRGPKGGQSVDCLIWSHHGEGSGASDPVARLKKVAPGFPQVDIFVQGHNTALASQALNNIWFYGDDELKMRSKKQQFVASGGFMTGYTAGSKFAGRAAGSYVERGMMRPSAIGAPVIYIEPRRKHDYSDLSIHVSV